jgi:hypothetical protein
MKAIEEPRMLAMSVQRPARELGSRGGSDAGSMWRS